MKVTRHGEKRLRSRAGLNKKSVDRQASIALCKGLKLEDTSGKLARYIMRKQKEPGTHVRIYGGFCYVFGYEKALITVFGLPTGLQKVAAKVFRRKNER